MIAVCVRHLAIFSALVLVGGLACTEPNPFAQEAGGETSDVPDLPDLPELPGCGEPQCSLALEFVEFSLQGDETFTAELAKPPQTNSVPIAAVHRYAPGQSETLGYAIRWTDNGDNWGLEVTASGAAPNSRIAGVAAVIGLGEDFPAPEVHELELTAAQACGSIMSEALEGRFVIETVERYEPGDATVFEFSRSGSIGDAAAIEYCVTPPEAIDATLGVKLVAFELPEDALGLPAAAMLDSGNGASESFAELGSVREVVHLIGAQALSEAAEPSLGYAIDCAALEPYACTYELLGFKTGAAVEVGGSVLAVQ